MRNEKEMYALILSVAEEDERIRAVMLNGSRADPEAPRDCFQDYDIIYFVRDIKPFYNNMSWIHEKFGKPLIVQTPDIMPSSQSTKPFVPNKTRFAYLMILQDKNRIDLTVCESPYENTGEPARLLLDKDGAFPNVLQTADYWHIKKPAEQQYANCCNEFWWCLNNVAKGIARGELPYVMEMLNLYVRDMLNLMAEWYIGGKNNYGVSAGKGGKYFKKYLPHALYESYAATYPSADYADIKRAVYEMCALFRSLANEVAAAEGFAYCKSEDDGMTEYLKFVFEENHGLQHNI